MMKKRQCTSLLPPSFSRYRPKISAVRRYVAIVVFAAMLALISAPAAALESPVSIQPALIQPANEDVASLEAREAEVKSRLDQIRDRLAAVSKDGAASPAAATESEWTEYNRLLNLIINDYEHHLDAIDKFSAISQSRQDFQRTALAWTGFSEPPPYSVDFVDEQWKQVRLKDHELETTRLEQTMFDSLLEARRKEFQVSSQHLRKANEELENAKPDQIERGRWRQELQALRNQWNEARLGLLTTGHESRNERLAHLADEKALLLRKAFAASRSSPMSQTDLDKKLDQLAKLQLELEAETSQAIRVASSAGEQLQRTRARLNGLDERMKSMPTSEAEAVRQEYESTQQILEADQVVNQAEASNLRMLRLLTLALVNQRHVWEARYQIDNAEDLKTLKDAEVELEQGLARLSLWRQYLKSELDTIQVQLDNQKKRLAAWQTEYGDPKQEERKRAAYAGEEKLLRRVLGETEDLDIHITNMLESLRLKRNEVKLSERLKAFYAGVIDFAEAVSDSELVAIDDTLIVEGREITGKRSVTVGKVAKVLAIFAVGLWLVNRIANFGYRRVTNWRPTQASGALLGLRLFSLIAIVAIVVFALVSVHIPLTVFTFFGGALAIGVGFGAQNIINNFISGLILLMERSIKLGDIVEVDGVLCRVTHIGSRCCQVHRFDGIDMLIPNSGFLEKNVTNWTLSDQRLRCTITVGIAYGSPVRKALALVERAAAENPQVMKLPGSDIYLQEFGDNALSLRLDFWVDLLVQPNRMRLMSDIRLRIEELFAQHGIAIAFPQRDVHLDLAQPVKVELATAAPQAGSA